MKVLSSSFITQFFYEIYKLLLDSETDAIEIWCELYEIDSLKELDEYQVHEIIDNYEFISIKKGVYTNFFAINKILFIINAIKISRLNSHKLLNLIDANGFELLVQEILKRNGFKTLKNFRFSDKSYYRKETNQTKYEVDVIGLNQNYLLIIDAKQWKKRDVYSAINKAANLQYQRAIALQKNPEVFSDLIQKLIGVKAFHLKFPLILIPLMVTFEDNWNKVNENYIPLVSIHQFNSFLNELRINIFNFKILKINKISIQKQLF